MRRSVPPAARVADGAIGTGATGAEHESIPNARGPAVKRNELPAQDSGGEPWQR